MSSDDYDGAQMSREADRKAEEHRKRVASRPSFESILLLYATALAERSTCRRLKVGCVIVSPDFQAIYSSGYNGNARGLPNDCDSSEPGACGDIHAEANALVKCDVPRTYDKLIVTTHSPCMACAKLMINKGGVRRVIYADEYRIKAPLDVLRKAGIAVEHWPQPTGWDLAFDFLAKIDLTREGLY